MRRDRLLHPVEAELRLLPLALGRAQRHFLVEVVGDEPGKQAYTDLGLRAKKREPPIADATVSTTIMETKIALKPRSGRSVTITVRDVCSEGSGFT